MSDGSYIENTEPDNYRIMKDDIGPSFSCENCGSQSFKRSGNSYICNACGTVYKIVEKPAQNQTVKPNVEPAPQQNQTRNTNAGQTTTTNNTGSNLAACCIGIIIVCFILGIISSL